MPPMCHLLTVTHNLRDSSLPGSTPLSQKVQQCDLGFPQNDVIRLYYTTDHLGSIREMVDSDGTIRASYDYKPYGERTKLGGDLDSDFGYTGHYTHDASGLVAAPYRIYDPRLGRWLSRDPIGEEGGINLYQYVRNNPTRWIDPLGLKELATGNVTHHVNIQTNNQAAGFFDNTTWTVSSLSGLIALLNILPEGSLDGMTIAGHGGMVGNDVMDSSKYKELTKALEHALSKDGKIYLNQCSSATDAEFFSEFLRDYTISGNESNVVGGPGLGLTGTVRDFWHHPFTPKKIKSYRNEREVPIDLP